MAKKKSRSFGDKQNRAYGTKSYKKPRWMRIVRLVSIIILSIFLLLAITGMILHLISHYK